MAFLHRELIDGKKLVGFGIGEINEPDFVVNDLTLAVANLNVHAFDQQPMKRAIVFNERELG